MIFSKEYHRF